MKKSVKILWYAFGAGVAVFLLLLLLINLRLIGHMPQHERTWRTQDVPRFLK